MLDCENVTVFLHGISLTDWESGPHATCWLVTDVRSGSRSAPPPVMTLQDRATVFIEALVRRVARVRRGNVAPDCHLVEKQASAGT